MRLLNTTSYELRSFLLNIPPYAILSHTWGEEEVTFDLISDNSARTKLRGWKKVTECCRRALVDGWDWVWIDTCCINKADPTELGEVRARFLRQPVAIASSILTAAALGLRRSVSAQSLKQMSTDTSSYLCYPC
jgi:hypothetical protein